MVLSHSDSLLDVVAIISLFLELLQSHLLSDTSVDLASLLSSHQLHMQWSAGRWTSDPLAPSYRSHTLTTLPEQHHRGAQFAGEQLFLM